MRCKQGHRSVFFGIRGLSKRKPKGNNHYDVLYASSDILIWAENGLALLGRRIMPVHRSFFGQFRDGEIPFWSVR